MRRMWKANALRDGHVTFILILVLMMFGLSGGATRAQTTLVNAPATDVVAERKVYAEFDFITDYAWKREGSFRAYVPRVAVGVAPNIEAGVNVAFIDGAGLQPIEVQPNVKWRFYKNEEHGVAASLGCILYLPVTHRRGADTFGMCYSVLSKKFKGNYGPRFTGGGYALVGRQNGEGPKSGAIIGYEQPLLRRATFVVDWFSGQNRFGYVTPGVSFATTSKSTLFTGYTIANHGSGNNALFAFYGLTF